MFRNIFKSGLGVVISQVLNLAFIPILSRTYTPEQYGIYTGFLAFYVIISSCCTLRLADAIVLSKSKKEAKTIASTSILSAFVISGISAIIFFLFFDYPYIISLIMLISLFLSGFHRVVCSYFLKQSWFMFNSLSLGLMSISWALFQYLTSIFVNDNNSLIIGHFLGILFSSIVLLFVLFYKKILLLKKINLLEIKEVFKNYKSFVMYLTPYSILGGFRGKLIYFFVSSPVLLGYLEQTERITKAPVSLLSNVIKPVLYKDVIENQMNRKQITKIRNLIILLIVGFVPILIKVYEYRIWLINFILGEKWVNMENIFGIMLFVTMLMLLTDWFDRILDATKKQKYGLIMELTCFISVVTLGVLQYILDFSDDILIVLYIYVLVAYALLWLSFMYIHYKFSSRALVIDLAFLISVFIIFYILNTGLIFVVNVFLSNILYSCVYLLSLYVVLKRVVAKLRN